ncbi:pentapeptide repeat-containing protein [Ruegeria arenilitoris]|uniref:pentapeptide repeat-containing protein n=1 Tax=Ruegeria arenilitoris TaxID=1173585 RepID=UPI00147D0D79|nr:pentapeptide repeat-containing protein [Ruegeria arenilitoris]
MSESLLSFSEVLLFGRELSDLKLKQKSVRLAVEIPAAGSLPTGFTTIDGVTVRLDDRVLVQKGDTANTESGIYKVVDDGAGAFNLDKRKKAQYQSYVYVRRGRQFKHTFWLQDSNTHNRQLFIEQDDRRRGRGVNNFIGDQFGGDARLARIYGFAYDGTYYELPEPTIFLVHGHGESATGGNLPRGFNLENTGGPDTTRQTARAPLDPSVSGVAAADYQMANDIRVWNYDQADYTIRMDIAAGQIEEVLLDVYFEYDAPMMSGAKVSGAKVSGAKVSGAKVSGAKVSGAKVSGAKVSGAKARGE